MTAWRERRIRAGIVLRRRIPGAHLAQRRIAPVNLRRTTPVSSTFGFDRGTPVERHYIEQFLQANDADIRGCVLEIGDAHYTRRFGHDVTQSDVLDVNPSNRRATIIADLEKGTGMPEEIYDCVICTQTLMLTYDVRSAIASLAASLRSGGVLIGSVSGIAQISELDQARTGEYWRFTTDSVRRLLEERFIDVQVESRGNVFSAISFLHGLAAEELTSEELSANDPRYQLVVLFRAIKPDGELS